MFVASLECHSVGTLGLFPDDNQQSEGEEAFTFKENETCPFKMSSIAQKNLERVGNVKYEISKGSGRSTIFEKTFSLKQSSSTLTLKISLSLKERFQRIEVFFRQLKEIRPSFCSSTSEKATEKAPSQSTLKKSTGHFFYAKETRTSLSKVIHVHKHLSPFELQSSKCRADSKHSQGPLEKESSKQIERCSQRFKETKDLQKGHDQGRQKDQQPDEEENEKICTIDGSENNRNNAKKSQEMEALPVSASLKKPVLPPPKMGVFALYYILDKMGISSEANSYVQYKQEIEILDAERTQVHKKMMDELYRAHEKEKEAARWGIMTKVFSLIGSFLGIIGGMALIATGIGAIAGSLLVAAGVIAITNQIMEITGGWRKVADILPGDDPEKKRAVVLWMQIGIAVLCLILSGIGLVFGGFTAMGQAMNTAMSLIGGVATIGNAITTIGERINSFLYKDKIANSRRHDVRLTQIKHRRQDLMDIVEESPDRLEQLFDSLARNLDFLDEINSSYQRAWV